MPAVTDNLGTLLLALLVVNVRMTATAIAIAFPIACIFALGRLSRSPFIYYPVTGYVNVLRSCPLLMILFWAYYTGPMITGSPTSSYTASVIALTLFEIAYFTEIIRAGLQTIPSAQRRAALATGLTGKQAYYFVVLPQAVRKMTPSILTQSIIAFQDSTITSIIGVPDIVQITTIINAREQRPIELYAALAVLFFVICYALSLAIRRLERRNLLRIAGASAKA